MRHNNDVSTFTELIGDFRGDGGGYTCGFLRGDGGGYLTDGLNLGNNATI